MKAEYRGNMGCLQRDSVERKGHVLAIGELPEVQFLAVP